MRPSRARALAASAGAIATLAACSAPAAQGTSGTPSSASAPALPANCTPIETRPPNAKGQTPAFPGQTRICGVTSNVPFDVVVVAKGLEHPWSIEPLPANPSNALVLQVLVGRAGGRASPDTGATGVRVPDEARLVSVRTRKAP